MAYALPGLPKAELHLHLEGAIRPLTVLDLAREHGVDLPFRDLEEIERALDFKTFLQFLAAFQQVNRCLTRPADFERIARELVEDLVAQDVCYAEIRYAPMHPMRRGMTFDDVTAAVIAGLLQGQREHPNIALALICGLTRQWDCTAAAGSAMGWAGRGLDAIDIGGDEAGFPAEQFAGLYRDALAAGLQVTAHAGEAAGPESVWAAIRLLGVKRIGHGVRSVEDPKLLTVLRAEDVTLEVCPTSNVRTGVVASYEEHPLRRLWDAGVRVTISSDDPAMFRTSISQEYEVARQAFGFDEAELLHATRNAIEAGFCSEETKRALLHDLALPARGGRVMLGREAAP